MDDSASCDLPEFTDWGTGSFHLPADSDEHAEESGTCDEERGAELCFEWDALTNSAENSSQFPSPESHSDLYKYKQRFEWQKDPTIGLRIASILVLNDVREIPIFSSCPDYGTLLELAVFKDEQAEEALFIVTDKNEADSRCLWSTVLRKTTKHLSQPYRANFTGQGNTSGPFDIHGQTIYLLRRVCTWRNKPKDMAAR